MLIYILSLVEGLTVNFPKFGFCFPAKIFNAVDFPIPLVPTNPSTSPGRGIGNLNMKSQRSNSILKIVTRPSILIKSLLLVLP